jgi:UDP-2-acetamido-2,6-beta-L-arabino-hexul-4-ose reductase
MRIVISGHNGFVGGHLVRNISLHYSDAEILTLEKEDFKSENFNGKIQKDDFIYHLAGVNRADSNQEVYEENKKLNTALLDHLSEIKFSGRLFFSSSLQEDSSSLYGKAKKEARLEFERLSEELGFKFYYLKIPNVYGPFCKPNYNSFIATFSDKLIKNETPNIIQDNKVVLIYINDLIHSILKLLKDHSPKITPDLLQEFKVSEVLKKLVSFKQQFLEKDEFPELKTSFDLNLFNTFRSYIDLKTYYPKNHILHSDERGFFSELSRSGSKGQSSFSTTKPQITRGNHFHTRKIERFSVIKGKARIQLRKYLSDEIISFELDGKNPSFVDMPVWYTHNITNIGEDELFTFFWINEPYDENDPDTYMENV